MNLVLTALRPEAGVVMTFLRDIGSVDVSGPARAWAGRTRRGRRVVVGCVGPGRQRARKRGGPLLDELAPARVVAWGMGGALYPSLQVGDLVLSRSFIDGVSGELVRPDGDASRVRAAPKDDTVRVRSLTWRGPVLRTAARRRLARRHGCGLVQMEDAVLARLCRRRGLSFVALRTVTDDFASPRLPDPARLRFLRERLRCSARRAVRVAAPG